MLNWITRSLFPFLCYLLSKWSHFLVFTKFLFFFFNCFSSYFQVSHPEVFMMFSNFPHADNIIFQESGNCLLVELAATELAWWWSWELSSDSYMPPPPLQQFNTTGEERERQAARGWKLPACFCQDTLVSGHVSAAHVSWSEHKLSAWRTEKFLWQIPHLHSKPITTEELIPLQWAAPSLSWTPSCRKALHVWTAMSWGLEEPHL